MDKEYVMLHWESDWDDESFYINITEEGKIQKFNIVTGLLFEYELEVGVY